MTPRQNMKRVPRGPQAEHLGVGRWILPDSHFPPLRVVLQVAKAMHRNPAELSKVGHTRFHASAVTPLLWISI